MGQYYHSLACELFKYLGDYGIMSKDHFTIQDRTACVATSLVRLACNSCVASSEHVERAGYTVH